MKFLGLALAALVGVADAKKSISTAELKSRIQKGQVNKRSLMRNAKPYNEAARKLQDGEQEEWEINGLYSVQFDSCFSLTVQDDSLFDENIINYASQGDVVAEKSYVIFNVCYTEDCYYQSEDEKMSFITDIPSFFNAFYTFLPDRVENYCQACQENYDYCSGELEAQYYEEQANQAEEEAEQEAQEEDAEAEEAGEEEAGEGGRRKLSKIMEFTSRKLANNEIVQMIDCDACNAYECFAEEEEGQEQGDDVIYEFEGALEWLEELSGCQAMDDGNNNGNNNMMYAGLICNAEGNGVEIGVFMDEECQVYAPKMSYASLMSYSDYQYFNMSEEVVEYMFMNDFSCYQPEIRYTNPYEYEEEEENNEEEEEEYQAPEAAEWCNNLFGGEMEAVDLYDCGIDANEEQQEQEEEEYDENLYYYDWYSYQLTEEQADDASEVCQVVKALNGEYTTVYDKKNGGTLYNYKKQWGSSNSSGSMGTGAIVSIVVLLVVVAGAIGAFAFNKKSTSDKDTPLINNADGTMA